MAYKYNKTTWIDIEQDPEHATPLCSANLNNIENGLESVDLRTLKLEEDIKNIDVTGQIKAHNTNENSHQDIRNAIANIDVSTQINEHNSKPNAHSSILGSATLNTQDKTVKGAINETLNQITALQTSKADKNDPSFTGVMTLNEKPVSTNVVGDILIKPDLGITHVFITPKVVVTNGNTFTISGGLKLTKPLVEGTVVMSLPSGIVPQFPYHIFFNSWNYAIPTSCRLWVQTDGNIIIYGASQFPTQEIDLDFSRTVIF